MKRLAFFLVLFFLGTLNGVDINALSKKLKSTICQKENMVSCDSNGYFIHNNQYIKLDNNRVLVFFLLYNPTSFPSSYGTQNALVIFDKYGKWKVVDRLIDGSIASIKRDPYGGIWLSHPWNIEGTTPSLSYSVDGVRWQDIIFPNKRTRLSIEWMEMCPFLDGIALSFSGEEAESYWLSSYKSAISPNPKWQPTTKYSYLRKRCLNAEAINNTWQRNTVSKDSLSFFNGSYSIDIPNKIPIDGAISNLYSIQVGHFKLKESLDKVSRDLNEVIGYPIISKQLPNGSYKLFLGKFYSQAEAKQALKRLRRRYKQNRYINESFIVILPKE